MMNNYSEPDPPKKTAKKRPSLNALTLLNAIATDPLWSSCIRYNEFSGKVLVTERFPPDGREPAPEGYREWDENMDVLHAMLHFQANGFPGARRAVVKDALLAAAFRDRFHPVKDYLDRLSWDGTDRIHRLAEAYFKARMIEDEQEQNSTRYLEAASKCWMISAVARVMLPGCKADYLPVLVGPEAHGKSEGIRELCPHPDWFSEDLSTELGERDTKESLLGKWIIELSEIPHARREADRVKAFFSRRTDRFRKAYGESSKDHPRQNVFIGTSNDLELISVTGNRRFWPWDIPESVDIAAIRSERDQLWAEAVHRFKAGENWWPDKAIEKIAAEFQGSFTDGDETWFQRIAKWAANKGNDEPFLLETIFVGALSYECLPDGSPPPIDKKDQVRAGGVLKSLGYRRRRRRIGGIRGYWWQMSG